MKKIDARTLSPQTQNELRKQVVRFRKQGLKNQAVADAVGLHQSTASRIWQDYLQKGPQALQLGQRGRRHGQKRRLTEAEENELQKLLVDKTPEQLKLRYALWTREAVRLLIKKRYKKELPLRTITDYFKRWGFTAQKPIKRAYEQNPAAVKRWLEQDYPRIAARAKKEQAEIYWGDETGVENNAYQARGFAPKGRSPIVRLNAKKSRVNMLSAVTNLGRVRFLLYRTKMNPQLLIKFMSRLARDAGRKVYLILDNLRTHHSREVARWLQKNKEKIEVFYLPPYSPELNPDEYLNGDLKRNLRSGLPPRSLQETESKTRSFMKKMQKRPPHVSNYFRHPMIAYAA